MLFVPKFQKKIYDCGLVWFHQNYHCLSGFSTDKYGIHDGLLKLSDSELQIAGHDTGANNLELLIV